MKTQLDKLWSNTKFIFIIVCALVFGFGILYEEYGAVFIAFIIGAGLVLMILQEVDDDDTYDV